ncbi:MAG: sigma factor-like helix-turn-helix DNA-binding protein [Puia sp.]
MLTINREEILKRLPFIFPVGTPNRNHCVSEVATGAVFTMLSTRAIEGLSIYINPTHVFKLNESEASKTLQRKRPLYLCLTRALIPMGAVKMLPDVHPNAFKPKYFLEKEFARLFEKPFDINNYRDIHELRTWQINHFDKKTFDFMVLIRQAVDKLPPRQKKIFSMTRYENYFRLEAASKLQLPINTIDNELRNAIRFIRRHIRNENVPPDRKQFLDRPRGSRRAVILAPDRSLR